MSSRAPTFAASASVPLAAPARPESFIARVVGAVAFVHLLNDLIQATLPAIYPMLKAQFSLSFTQVGLISLVYQLTASLLQPWVGLYTDKRPLPWLLPVGMVFTLLGLGLLSVVGSFPMLLVASALIGVGSSTFHPEASRVARMASGGRFGLAQSCFQVGGNTGSAFGPLLAAAIVVPRGQPAIAWFMLFALLAIAVLSRISLWTARRHAAPSARRSSPTASALSPRRVAGALAVVAVLVFSKFIYMASLSNYYTFYLMHRFGLPVQQAQVYLFLFLAAVAAGTFAGGPLGDRIGRKAVIWGSILGVAPFTLLLPHVGLFWTGVLSVLIGLVMSSAFSALVVYAQELVPGRVGMIAGLMFGLMFGISGIAAAALGHVADLYGIERVYALCAFLPLLGVVAALLPDMRERR
jgi:FSR family fosmidomycin resistance protein-like MFS transporter